MTDTAVPITPDPPPPLTDGPRLVPEGEYTLICEDTSLGLTVRGYGFVRLRFTVEGQPLFAFIAGEIAVSFCERFGLRRDPSVLAAFCKARTFNLRVRHREWNGSKQVEVYRLEPLHV